jgi:hypothetical protein
LTASLASKTPNPHEEHHRTAQELSAFWEAQQLIERLGKDGALRIATYIRLIAGELRYGKEIDDTQPLLQMFHLIETERDAKGQRISRWAAAKAVAETMPGKGEDYKTSIAKRLLGKFNATLTRKAKIDELFS